MKKVYKKPALYVENFALAQSIAAGCGRTDGVNLARKASCSWGPLNLFTSATPNCAFKQDDFTLGDEYCYNAPAANSCLFHS